MPSLTTHLTKIKEAVLLNSQKAVQSLGLALASDILPSKQQPVDSLENNHSFQQPPMEIINQKVLQIDVIQSAYLLRSEQNIGPLTHQQSQVQLSPKKENRLDKQTRSKDPSRLRNIEEEKKAIYEQLKQLDAEISEIKGETVVDGAVRRREKEEESEQAKKKAKDLVRQLKIQKKQIQQKKRKETEKAMLLLKQEEEELKRKREEQIIRVKEQKRKAIQARMQQDRKKREQRKLIQKQSNRLIKQLKREEQVMKQKQQLPHETIEIELKKKVVQKKQEVNFRQIQQHERRYIQLKQQERSVKKQRAQSSVQIPRYPKNVWIQQIHQQQAKRKQQQKFREAHKKDQLQKRKKYGQLVKNIFIPKPKKQIIQQAMEQKPHTPDNVTLPRIAESDKRVTDSKPMKKFIEQNRPFATAHNPKPPRPQAIQPKQPQDFQRQKQRKYKETEMRRQTKQRLKKLENRSLEALPQSKPKYQNYLGQVRNKLGSEASSWKKVIENQKMSKEEKYTQMVRRAAALESKAKVKEQMRKEGDQDALNLYIGSIQAKLAILQKF